MFTFGLLYVIVYLVILIFILTLIVFKLPIQLTTKYTNSIFIVFLHRYSNLKQIIFFLFFLLSGLPPVGLFFIKFSILSFILYQSHAVIILLLFFLFFLNMLFYLQVFNFKNFKIDIYKVVSTMFIQNFHLNFISYCDQGYAVYFYLYKAIVFTTLLTFFLFFYSDFYLILTLLIQ